MREIDQYDSLCALLNCRAQQYPDKECFTFLPNPPSLVGLTITYKELRDKAFSLSCLIRKRTVPRDRAILIYENDLSYVIGFFACLYAGVIAVPVYPPTSRLNLKKLNSIIMNSDPKVILTVNKLKFLCPGYCGIIVNEDLLSEISVDSTELSIQREDIAFLQYTSGSTGAPKGVALSHQNLLANLRMMCEGNELSPHDIQVSWLPLYHDMGLIGAIGNTIAAGMTTYLMSPICIARPYKWLKTISDIKATITSAPNFALDLATNRLLEEEVTNLDLSTLRVFVCAGEHVNKRTIREFCEKFKKGRFDERSLVISYGLAEATLMVAHCLPGNGVVVDSGHVSCGTPVSQTEIIIVSDSGELLKNAREEGNIFIHGPSVATGYWRNESETGRVFRNKFGDKYYLDTGDIGFFDQYGRLYISGRKKEILISKGIKYFPTDIEDVVRSSHKEIEQCIVGAFSVTMDNMERIVVAVEVPVGVKQSSIQDILAAIRRHSLDFFKLDIYDIVAVKRGAIPRTTSGKIQRGLCSRLYAAKKLDVLKNDFENAYYFVLFKKRLQRFNIPLALYVRWVWHNFLKISYWKMWRGRSAVRQQFK